MGLLNKLQPLGLLVLRLVLGAIMIAHGYPKIFGGLHHHVDVVRSLGIPGWMAYLSAAAEFGGIKTAASTLGFSSVAALQDSLREFCDQ